tara:strand:- start:15714 stop:16442 length:729 start_codon:yes stop_codon:yes gene_type:complete
LLEGENQKAYKQGGVGQEALEDLEEAYNINAWIAGLFHQYLGEKNLELGAGTGTISNFIAKNTPLDLCEASEACQKTLRQRFPENKVYPDFYTIENQAAYDCIYSSNVLEHFADDVSAIIQAEKLLKDGGYFVAYVPALQSLYSDFDKMIGHFRRYNNNEIARIHQELSKQKSKMQIQSFQYFNPVGAMGWLVNMKWKKKRQIDKKDVVIYNKIFPFIRWTNLLSRIVKGQNMLIVFKKVDL